VISNLECWWELYSEKFVDFSFYKGLFEIVVTVVIQSAFHLEMHQNNVFSFFKNHFLILAQQNDLKT
jgi:hypothetical protein